MPLAKALRELGHNNRIGFFLHIPCPPPEILTALPHHERLIPALCEYDLVGFQTGDDAFNFAATSRANAACTAAIANFIARRADDADRRFPVGIETDGFRRLAQRAITRVRARGARRAWPAARMIIGVDRLDYSKGSRSGWTRSNASCRRIPEWRGKVTYLQITPKSRTEIPEYADIGRRDRRGRGPHQRRLWRSRLDADPLRQSRLQPLDAGRPLSRRAGRRW